MARRVDNTRQAPAQPTGARSVVAWDRMESPLGPIHVAWGPQGICLVTRGQETADFLEELTALHPSWTPVQDGEKLAPVMARLERFFQGEPVSFDFPVDLSPLTPFQQAVLEATRAIPPGQVMTYGEIAAAIGRPRASRAVGQALRRNPVSILIPCHRVVGSGGALGGYGGPAGAAIKRRLLALEGHFIGTAWPDPVQGPGNLD